MTLLTITGCVVASIIHVAVGPLVQAAVDVNTITKLDCLGQCDVFASVKDKHEACLSSCLKVRKCLSDEVGKTPNITQDVCVLNCKHGCREGNEKFAPQMWACIVGCSAPEYLISDGKVPEQDNIESGILSDNTEEEFANATDPVGVVQESTQNVSLTLGGVVKTDVKSSSLLTPGEVDTEKAVSEKNKQNAKNISIDVQGLIGNVSKIHEAVTDYGEEANTIPREKNKEDAENISLAILGSINRTGYGSEVVTELNTGKKKRSTMGTAIIAPITKPGETEVELKPKVGEKGEGVEKGGKKGKGKEKGGKSMGKEKGGEKGGGKPGEKGEGAAKVGEKGEKEKGEEKGKGKGGKGKGKGGKKGEGEGKGGEKGVGEEKAGEKGKEKGKKEKNKKGKEGAEKKAGPAPGKTPAVGPAPAVKPP